MSCCCGKGTGAWAELASPCLTWAHKCPLVHKTTAASLLWLGAGAKLAALLWQGQWSGDKQVRALKMGMGLREQTGTIRGKEGAELSLEEGMKSRMGMWLGSSKMSFLGGSMAGNGFVSVLTPETGPDRAHG